MKICTAMLLSVAMAYVCAGDAQAAIPLYVSDMSGVILAVTQGWGELGIDEAAHATGQPAMPLQIKDNIYKKGLGSHANGEVVVNLGGAYTTFEAEVGVQWQPGGAGSVVFIVFADGKEVFNSGKMLGTIPAKPVKVSIVGAQELRLVTTDAGDGIICDMANWAEARITPNPAVKERIKTEPVNVAASARVLTWDPSRMEGCRNGRLEEFPADELYLGTDVVPNADGVYTVPKAKDGRGCIGIQWIERRRIKELGIQFADASVIPPTEGVQVQYWALSKSGWASGVSVWQGKWQNLNGKLEKNNDRWTYIIDWNGNEDRQKGTLKVRWIFPVLTRPVSIRRMLAFTESRWNTADLMLQYENAADRRHGSVKMYNGEIVGADGKSSAIVNWNMRDPLHLKVRYCTTTSWMTDRAVLRLALPNGSFGVAVDDVLANGCVYVKDFGLFVTREPVKVTLAQYKKKIARKKTILERVRDMPDQTFKQAEEHVHRSAADFGPTMISLACDNHKFIVSRDGEVGFDNNPEVFNCIERQSGDYSCQLKPEFGSGTSKDIGRHLQGGWLPIPVTTVKDNGVVYRQRTFVAPYDKELLPIGSPVWMNRKPLCVAEFTIENTQPKAADMSLKIRMFSDVKNSELAKMEQTPKGTLIYKLGKPLAALMASDMASLKCEIKDGVWSLIGELPASGQVKCVVYIPAWDAKADEIMAISGAEQLAADTEYYWKRVMAPAMKVEIPEPLLQNVIIGSQVHCMLAARNEDYKNIAPWIASFSYGPLESESQSPIRGMEFTGNFDFARRAHDYFIKRYNKQGFLTPVYTVMGTGWHLWCLGEYYQLFKDKAWLRANADEIARVCTWVMTQCEKTKKVDAFGNKVPEWGLMPPGAMADWEIFCFYFYLNSYYYAGLNVAGHALEDIAYPGAQGIIDSAADLKENIIRAFHRTQSQAPVYPLQNGTWVPAYPTHVYCPSPINNFYKDEDLGRSWCYDVELGAHHIIPLGVIDPNSKDADWIMNHMEDVQFLASAWMYDDYSAEKNQKDWFNLGGFAKVQPYYARTTEVYSLQDNVKAFIRSYFNSVISLLNREDLSLWEHFYNGAYNKTHETGYFLYQSRTMFVTERGENLWLAPFVTYNWLKDGMEVAIGKAPTKWGDVSYRIKSHVKNGYIEAEIVPPTREMPKEIVLRLRHPEGKKMKSATIGGKPSTSFDPVKETITIKPGHEIIVVRADY